MKRIEHIIQNDAEINKLANALVDAYRSQINKDCGYDTDLSNNIKSEVLYRGNKFEIILDLPDYWYYVENGRGPGKQPPVNKIVQWMKKRNIVPRASSSGKVPSLIQTAYAISYSISILGTEGKHSFAKVETSSTAENILNLIKDRITTLVQEEAAKETSKLQDFFTK